MGKLPARRCSARFCQKTGFPKITKIKILTFFFSKFPFSYSRCGPSCSFLAHKKQLLTVPWTRRKPLCRSRRTKNKIEIFQILKNNMSLFWGFARFCSSHKARGGPRVFPWFQSAANGRKSGWKCSLAKVPSQAKRFRTVFNLQTENSRVRIFGFFGFLDLRSPLLTALQSSTQNLEFWEMKNTKMHAITPKRC